MKATWVSLRRVITGLGTMVIGMCLIGGVAFFIFLRQDELAEARRRFAVVQTVLAAHLDDIFNTHRQSVAILAGDICIREVFLVGGPPAIAAANEVLDLYSTSLGVEVSYLIDRQGLVLASSNRRDPDSFVGKSYAFRPYFIEALAGRPAVYPALGVTSGRRGIYFSYPVAGTAPADRAGVVVIKIGADHLEEHFAPASGSVALSDADGMVLLSNRADWRLQPLWPPPEAARKRWEQSRQFGPGPWRGPGLERKGSNAVVDPAGESFWTLETPIAGLPGWQLMTFLDQRQLARAVRAKVAVPGVIILLLCLTLFGLGWYFLAWGRREMRERSELESSREALIVELRESLAQVKTLGGLLPICAQCKKIRDDKGYWQQVEVYVHEHTDAQFTHGICPECAALLFPGIKVSSAPKTADGKAAS